MNTYLKILACTVMVAMMVSCSSSGSDSGPTRFSNADGLELTLEGFTCYKMKMV